MASQITRTTQDGTLYATYAENANGKNKLARLTFNDKATEIALSKVWVNNWPAYQLKGFKSYIMPEGIPCKLQGDSYEITLNDSPFKTITLTIKVTGDNEQTLVLSVPENLKGVGLKQIIAKKLAVAELATIHIKYEGYPLDSSFTLNDSGIETGAELTLHLSTHEEKPPEKEKITDGALELVHFPSVQPGQNTAIGAPPGQNNEVTKKFAKPGEAPRWRVLNGGLNLRAICATKTCQAFQQIVWVQVGMGKFRINEESAEAKCPECKNLFAKDITNFAFYDCTYHFTGKMIDNTPFDSGMKIVPKGDSYVTFEEILNGVSTVKEWKVLIVTTAANK